MENAEVVAVPVDDLEIKQVLLGSTQRGACWRCTAADNHLRGVSKYKRDAVSGKLLRTKKRGGKKILNDGEYNRAQMCEFEVEFVEVSEDLKKIRVRGPCKYCGAKSTISAFVKNPVLKKDEQAHV